jgi:hypothetical protein
MGRTPDWMKHHTVMLNKLEDKRSQNGKNLANRKEWPLLTGEQQHFLVRYAVNGDVKRAADEMEVNLAWVHQQEEDENFSWVMRNITTAPKKMAEKLALNALPLSVYLLVEQIKEVPTNLSEKKFRLDAIRHLHKLTGLQKTSDVGGTNMMQVNFDLQGLKWGTDPGVPIVDSSEYMDEVIESEANSV